VIDDQEWTVDTWRRAASALSEQLTEATTKLDRYRKITVEMDNHLSNVHENLQWANEQLQDALKREKYLIDYTKVLGALVEAYASDNQPAITYYMGLCMEHVCDAPPQIAQPMEPDTEDDDCC
jgi:hypothetical protein